MNFVFIEPRAPGFHVFSGINLPRLGLPLIGTILKDLGHNVRIFCEELTGIDWKAVSRADVVGISTITPTTTRAYLIARKARLLGKTVVMGGPHVSFNLAEALENCDFVVVGEGEESMVELVDVLEGKRSPEKVRGLAFKKGEEVVFTGHRPLICNLDELPSPDLSLIDGYKKIRIAPVMTSRGCPHSCSFCSVTRMFGRKYRSRSPEKVIEDLKKLGKKAVFFYDDNFTHNRKRLIEICQGIIDAGLKIAWSAQTRIDIGRFPEVLKKMKQSGCQLVHIGFESVNRAALEKFHKGVSPDSYPALIKAIREAGIRIHGMFVLGSDEDTVETVRETVRFARQQKLFSVQFLVLTPLPGTPVFQDLLASGRLLIKEWSLYDGHHAVFKPARMTIWELQRESVRAMLKFYSQTQLLKSIAGFQWAKAYYIASARKKIRGWLEQNRDFMDALARAAGGQVYNSG